MFRANIVVALKRNADRPDIRELVAALQSPEIQAFITNRYNGAVIPVATRPEPSSSTP
ncbi:MAG: MetQ/NlpA family ABC transporter substrate-binding protein [Kiritimatiellia bacterium]